ncbi:MAG: nucleotidyltransferase family protein [Armatimonadetes bacterium]|nr:nucleotidyltransferase family protein [Armatimonadota bacterium]
MTRPAYPVSCPSPGQTLLLRAALLDGAPALQAWEQWRREGRPAPIPARLAPVLFANLHRFDSDAPGLEALKPAATRTAMQVLVSSRVAEPVLSRLQAAGIATILLKGMAMAQCWYPSGAARGFGDCDVLVRWKDVERAQGVLRSLGWYSIEEVPSVADSTHAREFLGPNRCYLDLHWFALGQCRWSGADDALWQRARSWTMGDAPTHLLDATDQFCHVCLHGMRNDATPWAWTCDAVTLIRTGDIDWARVHETAVARRLVPAMTAALRFLRDDLNAAIPGEVVQALEGLRVPLSDRLLFHIKTGRRPGLYFLLGAWLDYVRFRRPAGTAMALAGFPAFLRARWGLTRWRDLPRHAMRRLGQFLRRQRKSV